jgi:hypothetical protein
MFYAVNYKAGKVAIYDDEDNSIEWWGTKDLKELLFYNKVKISGLILAEKVNPIYTVDGLVINPYYLDSVNVGRFRVSFLKKGVLVGRNFEYEMKQDSLSFYDRTSFNPDEYPNGQLIATYHLDTILNHDSSYGLVLDASVSSWKLTPEEVKAVHTWLLLDLRRMRKNALY